MIKAAVLGSPIAHSLSPLLHTIAYAELGVEGEYTRIEVASGELESFLAQCDASWTGFSLTMPLKEEVTQLVEDISPLARRIKSGNTLIRSGAQWSATTTDVSGFTHALSAHHRDASGKVLIIGAGATARAAVAAIDGIAAKITVMNRSISRAQSISDAVLESPLEFISWGDESSYEAADLIISTTPEGVTDALIPNFPKNPTALFFDVLYKPWPTEALKVWSQRQAPVIDGLDLLIHQGIDQVALFTGLRFERGPMAALMRTHALKALNG